MKILFLGKVDDKTLAAVNDLGIEVSVFAEDTLSLSSGYHILITDRKRAGLLPQPFEHLFEHCVLLSAPDETELRTYEQLGVNKYTTHIEKFKCKEPPTTVTAFKENFLLGFVRSLYADPKDIRRAMKSGNKFGMHGVFQPDLVVK